MKGIYNKNRRTKRFVLLFCEWWNELDTYTRRSKNRSSHSWQEYDTLEEAREEINLIEEIYKDQLLPIDPDKVENKNRYFTDGDYTNGGKFWGYVLLDYEKERAILSGGKGYHTETKDYINNNLVRLDDFFRGPNEIPEGYKWDDGEFEGWLQFRWGDGKNSLDYVEPPKPRKEKEKEKLSENYLYDLYDTDYTEDENDEFLKEIEQERLKRLRDKW